MIFFKGAVFFFCIVIPFLDLNFKKTKTVLKFFCASVALLILLSFPVWQERMVYDNYDKKLIGQHIKFKIPVSYIIHTKDTSAFWFKEEIEIGRSIVDRELLEAQPELFAGSNSEPVPDEMSFTIIATYWSMNSILGSLFTPNIRKLVLLDTEGKASVALIGYLAFSNKPEFVDLAHDKSHRRKVYECY